jgi:hypothetical protein
MKSSVFLYLPSFDQNKILKRKKNSEVLFERNIKIVGFLGINKVKCDINLKNEFELLKKVSKTQLNQPETKINNETKKDQLPKVKFENPLFLKKNLTNELSSTISIKKLGNFTSKSTDCNGLFDEADKTIDSKGKFKGAFLRQSIHSASLKSIKLKNSKADNNTIKKTLSLRKIEWEYSSRLKYLEEKNRSATMMKREESRKIESGLRK